MKTQFIDLLGQHLRFSRTMEVTENCTVTSVSEQALFKYADLAILPCMNEAN